jgi:DNA-damage-inducible protein D
VLKKKCQLLLCVREGCPYFLAYFFKFFKDKITIMDNQLTPFEGEAIRKLWHDEQWYFNVSDVIAILTDSKDPKAYWRNLKKRLLQESKSQSVSNCYGLKFEAKDGKKYLQDAANTEGILRIVMSVPSPKAEPLKLWLAEQGKQALDEAENPELLTDRQAELYKAKGYSDEWIQRRLQSIETRKELTDEWKNRGVKEGQEYSILTATIAKGTFGLTPSEHKDLKGLNRQNLRDHYLSRCLRDDAFGIDFHCIERRNHETKSHRIGGTRLQ